VSGNVLDNDSNTGGEDVELTATLLTDPDDLPGTLVLNEDGTFTFTPDAGFSGPVSAVYKACGGNPETCAIATLYILVEPAPISPIIINSVTVNEASDWAVFEVSGEAGQLVSLDVNQGSGEGFADLGENPAIEYWNGSEWVAYTPGGLVSIPAEGPLYVRVNIVAEQDEPFEGPETFVLVATNASGTPAEGTGTIVDDGTGDYWIGDATEPATAAELAAAGIVLDDDRVTEFLVEQNYPNPFRGQTTIPVHLPEISTILIQIFDIEGKLIDELSNGQLYPIGIHQIIWNARNLASGVYIYRVIARGESGRTYSKSITLTLIN
jgi:hypothetical protein